VRREHLLVALRVDERGGQVVARFGATGFGQLVHEHGQLHARLEHGGHRIASAERVGVACAQDHVGRVQDRAEFAARDPHHVADDEQRERLRERLDEIDLAALAHGVDHLCADRLDRRKHGFELSGRERARHDAALARVPWVVHVDERSEELHRLGRQVRDRDRALARAELVGPAADLDELGVAGGDGERLGESRHRVLEGGVHERAELPELREARHPVLERLPPELRVDQFRSARLGHRTLLRKAASRDVPVSHDLALGT
jgi:hypothetical protein